MAQGHIRRRGEQSWELKFDDGRDPATGKRRIRYVSFKGTKREAQDELTRLLSARNEGTFIEPSKLTVVAYLDQWLDHMRSRISPRTHERYAEIVHKNIVPALGGVILTHLKPIQITDAYAVALAGGRRDGKGGLSGATVHYMHRILKHALRQAVRWQLLARNPADAVDAPKVQSRPMQTYDLEQTAALIEALRGSRLLMPVMLAVLCGLRRGEIAALHWRNVDLDVGQIAVVEAAEQTEAGVRYKKPKSGKGRTVALSATMIEELKAHRAAQAQELLKLGVRLDGDSFVVAQADGSPLQPRTLTQEWRRAITGLPPVRFHDLRHAHATHMLAAGIHPKVASERLGHSKVGITLDLYSHVLPGMQADAAARVDDALRAALQKRRPGD